MRIALSILRSFNVDVYLFGSAAKGNMTRHSDIDVAVLAKEPLPSGLLAKVRDALEQSNILYNVDLVDLSEAPEEFKVKVLQQGTLWKD